MGNCTGNVGSIMSVVHSLAFVVGLILVGETTTLSFSAMFSNQSAAAWTCVRNIGILITDMILGLCLLGFYFFTGWFSRTALTILLFCCLVGLLTHIYRDIQYVRSASACFCFNKSLFFVNNAKLAGLLWLTGYFVAAAFVK